jgi:hypothetical protein
MAKREVLEIGKEKWDVVSLRSMTEEKALRVLGKSYKADQIRNAWKQANKKK